MRRIGWRWPVYVVLLCVALGAVGWRVYGWLEDGRTGMREGAFPQEKAMQVPDVPHERYLLLVHGHDDIPEVVPTRSNLEMALRYAKLPYDLLTFEQWRDAPPNLDAYVQGGVIVIGERQGDLVHVDRLQRYVAEQGGLLVNAIRSANSPLNGFMGVQGETSFREDQVTGLAWKEKVYPGLSEQTLSEEKMGSSSLQVRLDPAARVWAETLRPEPVPYLWMMPQGKGRTLYWNTTALQEKMMRGAFVQAMMKAQGGVKMTVGAQVWFLDDFPAPAYNRISNGNRTGLTDSNFRLKQWDPDMQELARKHGIRYSAGVIFTYNDQVQPPFELPDNLGHEKLFELESKVVSGSGGELGLHGYNHQSLNLSYNESQQEELGYVPWPSTERMRQALQEARRLWPSTVKTPLPTMYIPPSNVLSPEGKRALAEVFPELKTISAIYVTNEELGGFEQEYLPDPDYPQIMGTPRMTYGFRLTADEQFDLYSGIGSIGIVSHFNHPDDVFHDERSRGLGWPELRDSFDELVGGVEQRFPWLQPLTATELSDELRKYHGAEVRIDRSKEKEATVYASPLSGPLYAEVRAEQPEKWRVKEGGEIVGQDREYGLLWVKMTEPKLVLEVAE